MRIPQTKNRLKRNEKAEAEQLSEALPALLLRASQLVKEFNPGVHGRRKAGVGEDFWQFKQYSPETAASAIDWRQSAKRDQLFIRQKELETTESVWFWRDSGPAMHYRSDFSKYSKISQASVIALAAGLLLTRGGENFGLLGLTKRASHGPVAFDRFTHDLMVSQKSDLIFDSVHSGLSKNTHIVLISDFLKPLDHIENVIRFFSKNGCRGILIHIADPAEIELPFNGRIRFEGMGDDLSLTVGRTEAVREEYQTLFSEHKSSLRILAQSTSWDYIFYRTDMSAADPLAALYQSLQWRGK